jgi:predicted nucleic acid-binding Zn ribbon protein
MSKYKSIGAIIRGERERLWRTSPGLGLQSLWEQAAGADIAASTEVRSFRDGVMTVSCESGGWACELQLTAAELTARLNALRPPEAVKEIRFVHQARGGGKSRK